MKLESKNPLMNNLVSQSLSIQHAKFIWNLAALLGWQDVRQAYRRSAIGQFWITAGMAVQIVTIGTVFGLIFKTPMETYLPFIAVSIILWGLISATLGDGCNSFVAAEGMIKQLNLPLSVHVLRVVIRNIITMAHNVIILPLAFLVVLHGISLVALLAIPGLIIVILNLSWLAFLLGTLSARYRDLPPIVSSLLTVAFYVTPVMWYPSALSSGPGHFFLGLNPFYHLIQVVRLPLLGEAPTVENWILSMSFVLVGFLISFFVFRKNKNNIPLWV